MENRMIFCFDRTFCVYAVSEEEARGIYNFFCERKCGTQIISDKSVAVFENLTEFYEKMRSMFYELAEKSESEVCVWPIRRHLSFLFKDMNIRNNSIDRSVVADIGDLGVSYENIFGIRLIVETSYFEDGRHLKTENEFYYIPVLDEDGNLNVEVTFREIQKIKEDIGSPEEFFGNGAEKE